METYRRLDKASFYTSNGSRIVETTWDTSTGSIKPSDMDLVQSSDIIPTNQVVVIINGSAKIRAYISRTMPVLHAETTNADQHAVVLIGLGKFINKAISVAELLKRFVPGLHQVSELSSVTVKEQWEPKEHKEKEREQKDGPKTNTNVNANATTNANANDKNKEHGHDHDHNHDHDHGDAAAPITTTKIADLPGLQNIETSKAFSCIRILLARNKDLVDSSSLSYQAPLDESQIVKVDDYDVKITAMEEAEARDARSWRGTDGDGTGNRRHRKNKSRKAKGGREKDKGEKDNKEKTDKDKDKDKGKDKDKASKAERGEKGEKAEKAENVEKGERKQRVKKVQPKQDTVVPTGGEAGPAAALGDAPKKRARRPHRHRKKEGDKNDMPQDKEHESGAGSAALAPVSSSTGNPPSEGGAKPASA